MWHNFGLLMLREINLRQCIPILCDILIFSSLLNPKFANLAFTMKH